MDNMPSKARRSAAISAARPAARKSDRNHSGQNSNGMMKPRFRKMPSQTMAAWRIFHRLRGRSFFIAFHVFDDGIFLRVAEEGAIFMAGIGIAEAPRVEPEKPPRRRGIWRAVADILQVQLVRAAIPLGRARGGRVSSARRFGTEPLCR